MLERKLFMTIYRTKKEKNFTIMSNYHLQDNNLSLKDKGLLSYMLSLPDDWNYSLNGLTKINKEGIKSIRSTLKELEKNKYLIRKRLKNEDNKFYYIYDVFEVPYPVLDFQTADNEHTPNGYTKNEYIQKDIQINTNINNTKKEINNNKEANNIVDNKSIDEWDISSFFDINTIDKD